MSTPGADHEFLQYSTRPLGPKSTKDIEDLVKGYKYVQQNHDVPSNHFDAHPRVKHFAPSRTTPQYQSDRDNKDYKRYQSPTEEQLIGDWSNCNATVLSERDALLEAARCLKCSDAPCISACPSSVDIPAFIQAIENQNYYTAAKIILSANSNGASCGSICATSDLCSGSCTLATPHSKGINIEGLQAFALHKFAQMNIQPTLDPTQTINNDLKSTKIAIIGAGPAGLSAATFLARLGYTNITVFEKENAAGGINTFELPEFRLPHEDIKFEVSLLTSLGVKFVYGRTFVETITNITNEISYEQLTQDGFKQIFLGFGRPQPIVLDSFKGLGPKQGVYNSKEFLPLTCIHSKPSLKELYPNIESLPDFTGKRVIVLGGGDVAVDSATTSRRLGSKNVSIVFRKNTADMRCMIEEKHHAEAEHIDFIPYCAPKAVILDEQGNVKAVEFYKQSKNNNGEYVTDEDEFIRLKADIVITAFGCKAIGVDKLIPSIKLQRDGCVAIDEYGQTSIPGVYAGGDLTGQSTTVGSSNDGKMASWAIHAAIQQFDPKTTPVELPNFHTAIDDVSLEVTVDGVTYPNPFVLASAPPCTSIDMIANAFKAGWGGAVVKTFVLDKDMVTNVSGRISVSTQGAEDYHNSKRSWFNIELITEKGAEYWYNGMAELKQKYPKNIVIASAMCSFDKNDWTEIITKSIILGNCDAVELNLSCPHVDGSSMGMEIGQCPDTIVTVVGWCVNAIRSTGRIVPLYVKLTPNITDITTLALAVERGLLVDDVRHPGGVTAINTVSGILGFKFDASARRHGVLNEETGVVSAGSGGYCGSGVRPLSFKAVTAIRTKCQKSTTILATGGIDSANVAYQFILAGAPILQVCSAVMNRDYSVVYDFIYGLKTLFYINQYKDTYFKNWRFQDPLPQVDRITSTVPKYGKLMREEFNTKAKTNPVWKINTGIEDDFTLKTALPQMPEGFTTTTTPPQPKQVGIQDLVGAATKSYVSHPHLSRFDQTVALINDDACIRCGRCYATCNDSGYQAISMDPITRKVVVDEDKCTSCGICESACPYPNTIAFVPRADNKILMTYRGEDIRQEVLKTYPLGLLADEVIQKYKEEQIAKGNNTNNGCQSKTCCGGKCKSTDEQNAPPA